MRGLREKRVLITGGSGGIGRATAARFIEEGSRVVLLDKDPVGLRQAAAELPALAGTLQADVSEASSVTHAFEELDTLLGGVDVLINNAGVSLRHHFMEITPEEWRKVLETNLFGVVYLGQQAARRMLDSDGGGV